MIDQDLIESLKFQHKDLEAAIDNEYANTTPDEILVSDLKRQKLRIKDELASLHAL